MRAAKRPTDLMIRRQRLVHAAVEPPRRQVAQRGLDESSTTRKSLFSSSGKGSLGERSEDRVCPTVLGSSLLKIAYSGAHHASSSTLPPPYDAIATARDVPGCDKLAYNAEEIIDCHVMVPSAGGPYHPNFLHSSPFRLCEDKYTQAPT